MKKFKVIAIHAYTSCDMNCPFCYKKKSDKKLEKPRSYWYEMIPYLKKLTKQVAVGGGEPFTQPDFIRIFSEKCKNKKLICNVTSNGRPLMKMDDFELKRNLKNIRLISLSFDDYKVKTVSEFMNYLNLVQRINNLTECEIGSNLLVNERMLKDNGKMLIKTVNLLFRRGVDRVFALCPKNMPCPDILACKGVYAYLTMKYKNFFVDDLTKMILQEKSYTKWKNPCHYGKGIISINEQGFVTGCSFDCQDKALLHIEKPKNILKIRRIPTKERFKCPYLIKPIKTLPKNEK